MALDPIYVQLVLALAKMYLDHQAELDRQTRADLLETLRRLNAQMTKQEDLVK